MKKNWVFAVVVMSILSATAFAFESDFSKLRMYDESYTNEPMLETSNNEEIASLLNSIGVRFEQWQAEIPLSQGASQEEVINAYQTDVARLVRENGYQSVDVLRMLPTSTKKEELRNKFINEHTHKEDEVRFFVEGSGLFYLHVENNVYLVLCEKGDLISIPANYAHWFDMGQDPYFTAIRFFIEPSGWIPHFTDSNISQSYPKYGD